MSATADVRADQKAGWCSVCRSGNHALCASPDGRCACPGKAHPNRPAARPVSSGARPVAAVRDDDPMADVRRRAQNGSAPAKPRLTEPVWGLVKADPPAPPPKPKKLTAIERARPLLEQIMAEGERDWHRIAIFPSSMAAGQTRGRLTKAYREFEFQAVRVPEISQSAIYVKWTGAKPGPLA